MPYHQQMNGLVERFTSNHYANDQEAGMKINRLTSQDIWLK